MASKILCFSTSLMAIYPCFVYMFEGSFLSFITTILYDALNSFYVNQCSFVCHGYLAFQLLTSFLHQMHTYNCILIERPCLFSLPVFIYQLYRLMRLHANICSFELNFLQLCICIAWSVWTLSYVLSVCTLFYFLFCTFYMSPYFILFPCITYLLFSRFIVICRNFCSLIVASS